MIRRLALAALGLLAACADDPPAAPDGGGGADGGGIPELRLAFDEVPLAGEHVQVTDLRFLPGTDDFLLLEKQGTVTHYRLGFAAPVRLGAFTLPGVFTETDCGLVSAAFDPGFAENRLLYLGYCLDQTASRIVRVRLDDTDHDAVPASLRTVITVSEPRARRAWHNVGSIGFDATGALWALFGDKTLSDNAPDEAKTLGKLLRILPNPDPLGEGYAPSPDNPFAGDPTRAVEVYASGFRSPWKAMLDDRGRWLVGDVGADDHEELDLVQAPAQDFGWPTAEGPCATAEGAPPCDGLTEPLSSYGRASDHPFVLDDPEATSDGRRAVWVAPAHAPSGADPYRGALAGQVLYGDFYVGFVRAVELDGSGAKVRDRHVGHLLHAAGFGTSRDGTLWVATYGTSVPRDGTPTPAHLFRARLVP